MSRLIAFVVALALAPPALAETVHVRIQGAALVLALPSGHCALDRAHPADRVAIETVERIVAKTNRVLAAFADCAEREAFRAGTQRRLDNFGQYMTPLPIKRVRMDRTAFAQQMTETFKARGAEVLRGAESQTRERIGALRLSMRFGESRMLGVLRTDERASYLGIVQSLRFEDDSAKLQVGVSAFGLVKERMVSLNLYSRFEEGPIGAETTLKLLDAVVRAYTATSEGAGP